MSLSFIRPATLVVLLLGTVELQAQTDPSAMLPKPEDVASAEAVVSAIYDVISGPATSERDWDRFKSLFVPGAHLIPTGLNPDTGAPQVLYMTPDEYVSGAADVFKRPGGFFENEIGRTSEVYGNIAHVFSTYESLREGESEPFMRGINSFQLFNDGNGWRIVNVYWQAETPDNPIPKRYLFD